MKRVSKLAGLVGKPLQRRFLTATEAERAELLPVVERESDWMVQKMARKGYALEATVAGVYGLFTRGAGQRTVRLTEQAVPQGVR